MNMRIVGMAVAAVLTFNTLNAAEEKKEEKKAETKAGTAGVISMDGSTTVGPIAKAFLAEFKKQNPKVEIQLSESGSGNGAKALLNGSCDIANMSRFMKNTEFEACTQKGVYPVAHVIALDGIAPIVHPSNPVKNLTIEQIKKIYTGDIKNWKDVGGPDKDIVVISRDTNSGTYEAWMEMVLGKEARMVSSAEYRGSSGLVRARVAATPGAIGYIGVGYVDDTVRGVPVNGIEPTPVTVRNGTYPISRPLFMFTNGYPAMGSDLYNFVTMYLTAEGQKIIEGIGFVPVTTYPAK